MRALLLGIGLLALTAGPLSAREERGQTVIRLLLERAAGSIRIERAGRVHSFERTGAGLRVDDGPIVPLWRGAEEGAWRLGSLWWRGAIAIRPGPAAQLLAVGTLPLEDYVVGALGGEIPALWPREVLRAQAVVSRTYALHEQRVRRALAYDLETSTAGQVYVSGHEPAPASLRRAVCDTRGEVLVWHGRPILAAFHSSSGGHTASAREVWGRDLRYLVGRAVSGEENSPDTYWRAVLTRTTLGRALAAAGHDIGPVRGVEVRERGQSRRVLELRLRGVRGEWIASGRALRAAVGESTLRSTLFEVRASQQGFAFVGSGSGHGVGMSQWGARALALAGADYRRILAEFYPGTVLVNRNGTSGADSADSGPIAGTKGDAGAIRAGGGR